MFQNKTHEETLKKEGFVIIPFLNDEELKELQKFYSDAHPNDEIPDMRYGIHMTSWCKDGQYKQDITNGLKRILQPSSERTFEDFRSNNFVFIIKNKGPYTTFPIHQDWSVIDETKYMSFNVWIPLQDVDQNTGALWIIKGSHRLDRHVRGANILFPDYSYLSKELKPYMHPMNAKAGQAVIFFHSTIHGSPPNVNEKLRKVACFTVLPKEAPLQIFFQKDEKSPLEIHQPDDAFMFKYEDINSESFVKPPTEHPVKVLPSYHCQKVTMEELIEVTKENYPKKKSLFDKIFH